MARQEVFKLEVAMINAALEDEPATELARILRNAADRIEQGTNPPHLFDINGNCVGNTKIVTRRE